MTLESKQQDNGSFLISKRVRLDEDSKEPSGSLVSSTDGSTVNNLPPEVSAALAKATQLANQITNSLGKKDNKDTILKTHENEESKTSFAKTTPQVQQLPVIVTMQKTSVDINDCRHRYLITKPTTQAAIEVLTGATLLTKGKFLPDRTMATVAVPALTIEISGPDEVVLKDASGLIKEIMDRGSSAEADILKRLSEKKSKSVGSSVSPALLDQLLHTALSAKCYLSFEPDFNTMPFHKIRCKILGPQGSYIKHIAAVSGAEVSLRGRGSGFVDLTKNISKDESSESSTSLDEPLHLYITAYKEEQLSKAKVLATDLLNTIKKDYEAQIKATSVNTFSMPFAKGTNRTIFNAPNPFLGTASSNVDPSTGFMQQTAPVTIAPTPFSYGGFQYQKVVVPSNNSSTIIQRPVSPIPEATSFAPSVEKVTTAPVLDENEDNNEDLLLADFESTLNEAKDYSAVPPPLGQRNF